MTEPILAVDGLVKHFGGLTATDDLSLTVTAGEIHAIIGPNGAGKTTMMDVITGKTRPDAGDVLFDENIDLTTRDEAAIAALGIGRKFQTPTVFDGHSVADNIGLAVQGRRGVWPCLFWRQRAEHAERVDEILDLIKLTAQREARAGALSHGQKQWLEIGMLLAQDPRLLLIDEPAAGMSDAETAATAVLLKDIARSRSVLVVEHDMDFVRDLGVKVTVLHEGSMLAEGPLEQVSADERVIDVYLGR